MEHNDVIEFIERQYARGSGFVRQQAIIVLRDGARVPCRLPPPYVKQHLLGPFLENGRPTYWALPTAS